MYNLLFSFYGRVSRSQFFLTTLLIETLVIAGLAALLFTPLADAVATYGDGLKLSDIKIGSAQILMSVLLMAIGVWVHLALVWKRSRDINNGTAFAYIYTCVWALAFIPVIGVGFAIISTIMFLVLSFKRSQTNAHEPEISGSLARTDETDDAQTSGFGSDITDADLAARAAQLRAEQSQPSIATPDTPVQPPAPSAPKSFGRRSRLQTN